MRVMFFPKNSIAPESGLVEPGQEVKDRCLARSVGSYQTHDLVLPDGERQIVDRLHAPEALAQARDHKRFHVLSIPRNFDSFWASRP